MKALREALEGVLFGQEKVVEALLATALAGGHALLEGMPGLGKTLLALAFAQATGLSFKRIQFTPDLLPQDLTGGEVFREGRFEFVQGPLFAHVVLADEVNRAPPKVQSALLEAMEERAVTFGGVRHPLPDPFLVLATQNPLELEGTYPLPEAQLDRFTSLIRIKPPPASIWLRILTEEPRLPEPLGLDLRAHQEAAKGVRVSEKALEAVVNAALVTQKDRRFRAGLSPRGAKRWLALARALAYLREKPFVDWPELKDAAFLALPHRLFLTEEALYEGFRPEEGVAEALRKAGVP